MAARLIDRRDFVAGAGVAFAAALLPRNAAALAAADAVYGAAFMNPAGEYGLAILSEKGEIISRQPLPAVKGRTGRAREGAASAALRSSRPARINPGWAGRRWRSRCTRPA